MSRYIDADLLKTDYFALPSTSGTTVSTQYVSLFQILNTPTADVVEVVRCKECVRHNSCNFEQYQGLDGFCSLGERRE